MSGIKDEHNKLSNQQLIRELKKKRLSKSEKQKKNKENIISSHSGYFIKAITICFVIANVFIITYFISSN